MKHVNIPVFVPHLGCPHDCVFCNQKKITGKQSFDISAVEADISRQLSTVDSEKCSVEIAFFGGSFTGIPKDDMLALLAISDKFVESGRVHSVRCSTRPDYIDSEILRILKEHNVKTVEIGVQSMDAQVLGACARGHSPEQTEGACRLIVESGLELVGQMMVGLPFSDKEKELETARAICRFGAKGARIYPTVVFKDTALLNMTQSGLYIPLDVEDAVDRCADIIKIFVDNGVSIIRIGLCESEGLHDNGIAAGAYHPALGEMCLSRYYYNLVVSQINMLTLSPNEDHKVRITVNPRELSKLIGQNRVNKIMLGKKYPSIAFTFKADESLPCHQASITVL